MAGLLGITVIGAVLRSREGVALRHGALPSPAFLDGYHAGLAVTIALVIAGAAVGYWSLATRRGWHLLPSRRPRPSPQARPSPRP